MDVVINFDDDAIDVCGWRTVCAAAVRKNTFDQSHKYLYQSRVL